MWAVPLKIDSEILCLSSQHPGSRCACKFDELLQMLQCTTEPWLWLKHFASRLLSHPAPVLLCLLHPSCPWPTEVSEVHSWGSRWAQDLTSTTGHPSCRPIPALQNGCKPCQGSMGLRAAQHAATLQGHSTDATSTGLERAVWTNRELILPLICKRPALTCRSWNSNTVKTPFYSLTPSLCHRQATEARREHFFSSSFSWFHLPSIDFLFLPTSEAWN